MSKKKGKSKSDQIAWMSDDYVNREISWLAFNERVLAQAADNRVPILERLNFLRIFRSNLDEFFMKRVGGLKRHIAAGVITPSREGLSPKIQLKTIREIALPHLEQADRIFEKELLPSFRQEGVEMLVWNDLSEAEKKFASEYFRTHVFPLLTPLAVDSGHPFPFISNLSTSLGVVLAHPDHEERLFARVKVSAVDPYWLLLEDETSGRKFRLISMLELVKQHLHLLFPSMEIVASMPFRVTRNADLEVDEEEADDLLELIEQELRLRRFAKVIRLEHGEDHDPWILEFLMEELELHHGDVYEVSSELDSFSFPAQSFISRSDAKFPQWTPVRPVSVSEESGIFSQIRNRDILVHHPFESFSQSVERFVSEAAVDPKVQSIKMTVYRVGDETPIIPLLVDAASKGKNVVCLVELKARFEEERNIHWAQKLEDSGVHVVYGIPGLKIHAKTVLVVRRESEGIRCYAHIGTGNYHIKTANLYTDFGLFTSKRKYTDELLELFNFLTGRSRKTDYEHLLIAPVAMNERFIALIQREAELAKSGRPARIVAKMNSLEDYQMIQELYRASQAGVQIDLIVRGVCCLRPGVKGLSDHIRVISIIGRLLEHSRIFVFSAGNEDLVDADIYIGSADWMSRNLHRRVELAVPIEDRPNKEQLLRVLEMCLADHVLAWEMGEDGQYIRRIPDPNKEAVGTHEQLMRIVRQDPAIH